MIRFKTESGTVYILDLETSQLVREGVPLISVETGEDMAEQPHGDEVSFTRPPIIGESFTYYHPTLFGCGSTPVVSIEEVDDWETK